MQDHEKAEAAPSHQAVRPAALFELTSAVAASINTPHDDVQVQNINFVVVHGPDDNVPHAWQCPNGFFWLRDWLPALIPSSRTFFYQYDPSIYPACSIVSIEQSAGELLRKLEQHMQLEVGSKIVFICHSLGGIVVKKAICNAQNQNRKLASIFAGVLFLGTPHESSSIPRLATIMRRILALYGGHETMTAMKHDFDSFAGAVLEVQTDFLAIAEHIPTVSVFELQDKTAVNSSDATRTSPLGQRSTELFLPFDHQHICQMFPSVDENNECLATAIMSLVFDSGGPSKNSAGESSPAAQSQPVNFANSSNKILNQGSTTIGTQNVYISGSNPRASLTLASETLSEASLNEIERECLALLAPRRPFGRQNTIAENSPGTLQWLDQNEQFTDWITSPESQLLLVTGYAGTGKSVLAGRIARLLNDDHAYDRTTCVYHFDGAIKEQADTCLLLRSIIYQIVVARHKLLRIVRKRLDRNYQLLGDIAQLWGLLETLAKHQKTQNLTLIIDGLDECSAGQQEYFVNRLHALMAKSSNLPFRALLTSRPYSPLILLLQKLRPQSLLLTLTAASSHLSSDVGLFIDYNVTKLVESGRCHEQNREALAMVLKQNAEATFLWVSLATALLHQRGLIRKRDISALGKLIPPSLQEMYTLLIEAIPIADKSLAWKALVFIGNPVRPLTLAELNALVSIERDHQSHQQLEDDYCISGPQSVESLLRGLVQTTESHAALIHYSLKEHLEVYRKEPDSSRHEISQDLIDHEAFARSCMLYLMLEDFGKAVTDFDALPSPTSTLSSDETQTFNSPVDIGVSLTEMFKDPRHQAAEIAMTVTGPYPLFDYAARYWTLHFARCQETASNDTRELALKLYDPGRLQSWFKYLSMTTTDGNEYPSDAIAINVLCIANHHTFLKQFLQDYEGIVPRTALYWAARYGNSLCLSILLSATSPQLGWEAVKGYTALMVAAAYGHTDCVKILISTYECDVNQTGPQGRTALSFAVQAGHAETTTYLLQQPHVDVNAQDHKGASILFWAVTSGSKDIVAQLLKHRDVNVLHIDHTGRDALSLACEYCSVDIVRLLLKDRARGSSSWDEHGRSHLIWAIRAGSLEIVKLLLRHGIGTISEQDPDGRNAISWAVQLPKSTILEYLLRKDNSCASVPDSNGWTPLAWTMDPPEHLENATLLLQNNHNVPNDDDALATFELANRWKAFGVARLLLTTGYLAANLRSSTGRTVLSYAAEHGDLLLIRYILSEYREGKFKADDDGRLPYDVAINARQYLAADLLDAN